MSAASSSGVPRIVSATLGLSFSAGAKCRIARTTSRRATTPMKMKTMVSTSGSSTLGVLYDTAANSPASSSPTSTEIIPSTVSQVMASHAGSVTVGNWSGRTIELATRELIDERGLCGEAGHTRLHAVVHPLGGDRRCGGKQPRLRAREEAPLLGATVRVRQPEQPALFAVPCANRQTTHDRAVVRDGAAKSLRTDGAFIVGEFVRQDPRDRRGVVARLRRRRRDGRCIGDSHWGSDCSAASVSRRSGRRAP